MKCFEKGHTFMREKKFMYDFVGFQNIIEPEKKSYVMDDTKFIQFTKEVNKSKYMNYPKLEDIRAVKFNRGSTKMFWKTSLRDIEWCSEEFTKKNYRVAVSNQDAFIARKNTPRGINTQKLRDIVGKFISHPRMKF